MPRLNDQTAQEIAERIVTQATKKFAQAPRMNEADREQLVESVKTALLDDDGLHQELKTFDNRAMDEFVAYAAAQLGKDDIVYQSGNGRRVLFDIDEEKITGALETAKGEIAPDFEKRQAEEEEFYQGVADFAFTFYPEAPEGFEGLVADCKEYAVGLDPKNSPVLRVEQERGLDNPVVVREKFNKKQLSPNESYIMELAGNIRKDKNPTSIQSIYRQAYEVSRYYLNEKMAEEIPAAGTSDRIKFDRRKEFIGAVHGRAVQLVRNEYTNDADAQLAFLEALQTTIGHTYQLLDENRKATDVTVENKQELLEMVKDFQGKVMEIYSDRYPEAAAAYAPPVPTYNRAEFTGEMNNFKETLERHLEGKPLEEQKEVVAKAARLMNVPERLNKGQRKNWDPTTKIEHVTQKMVAEAGGKDTEEGKMVQELGKAVARLERKGLRTKKSGAVIKEGEEVKPIPASGKVVLSEITALVNYSVSMEKSKEALVDVYSQAWEAYAKSGEEAVDFSNPTPKQLSKAYEYAVKNGRMTEIETVAPSEDFKAFAGMQDSRLVEAVGEKIRSEDVVQEAGEKFFTRVRITDLSRGGEDPKFTKWLAEGAKEFLEALKENPGTSAEKALDELAEKYGSPDIKSYLKQTVSEYRVDAGLEKEAGRAANALSESNELDIRADMVEKLSKEGKKGQQGSDNQPKHADKFAKGREDKGKEKDRGGIGV